MIDTPQILTTTDQPCAIIPLVIPTSEIREHMGAATQEIAAVLRAQGIPPTGPWFTHHRKIPDTHFDFEISFPTATPVTPSGRVIPSVWPATRVARTVHHGDYSGLVAAWGELLQWLQANNRIPAPAAIWEVYTINPDDASNPANWQTQLNIGLQPLTQTLASS